MRLLLGQSTDYYLFFSLFGKAESHLITEKTPQGETDAIRLFLQEVFEEDKFGNVPLTLTRTLDLEDALLLVAPDSTRYTHEEYKARAENDAIFVERALRTYNTTRTIYLEDGTKMEI